MSMEDRHEFQEGRDQAGSYRRRRSPLVLDEVRGQKWRLLTREERGQAQSESAEESPTPAGPERSETQRGNAPPCVVSAMSRAVAWREGGLKLEAGACCWLWPHP